MSALPWIIGGAIVAVGAVFAVSAMAQEGNGNGNGSLEPGCNPPPGTSEALGVAIADSFISGDATGTPEQMEVLAHSMELIGCRTKAEQLRDLAAGIRAMGGGNGGGTAPDMTSLQMPLAVFQ